MVTHPLRPLQVEDPALALLAPLVGPHSREQGAFEPPPEGLAEPARTERHLAHALFCGGGHGDYGGYGGNAGRGGGTRTAPRGGSTHAADATWAFERLRTWLGDASGATRGGVAYLYVQSLLQLLVALVVGIFEHDLIPGRSDRLAIQLSLLLALLAVAAVWTARGHANDRLQGFVSALAYTLEGISLCLLLAAPSPGEGLTLLDRYISLRTLRVTYRSTPLLQARGRLSM